MSLLFTWKDIERGLLYNQENWPNDWSTFEIYSDELVIFSDSNNRETSLEYLKSIFGPNFDMQNKIIDLFLSKKRVKVTFEPIELAPKINSRRIPLFKNIYTRKVHDFNNINNLPGVPIVAFHSYKGGVGRTLSLLTLLRELSPRKNGDFKALVIDGDVEAPGLTWLAEEMDTHEIDNIPHRNLSYLDLLEILNENEIDGNIVSKVASLIEQSIIKIKSDKMISNHYFVPAFRSEMQLMNIYIQPENIISSIGQEYIISDFLSLIGKALDADIILIDLRAGFSEHSAPFLFDPRIKRIIVTSTSLQSIEGTKVILKQVFNETLKEYSLPLVLLTMVPKHLIQEQKEQIYSELTSDIIPSILEEEIDVGLSNFITEIPFSSELIHLEGLDQIMYMLSGTEAQKKFRELANTILEPISEFSIQDTKTEFIVEKLHTLAETEITAEGNISSKMLSTESLQNLVRKFNSEIPNIVILGAKGSGKTYIYKQLINNMTWEEFSNNVKARDDKEFKKDTYILPILSTENRNNIITNLKKCIENTALNLNTFNIKINAYAENAEIIRDNIKARNEWKSVWTKIIIESFGGGFDNLKDIDRQLNKINKRVVLIIDGLEDIFNVISLDDNDQNAIKTLCQGIVNELNELPYRNLGIIIFIRKDIAEESIKTNFTQFYQQYWPFELKWTHTEALRLALWLACQVSDVFKPSIPVEIATREIIEDCLAKLWGVKLGKQTSNEAYSSRWILAALSDFNGQLQARDIIRFIKYATVPPEKRPYSDRMIMPSEIKKAIEPCSQEKIKEIKAEIKAISPIFQRFEDLPSEKRVLPFNPEDVHLTAEEKNILIKQGYLRVIKDQNYLPEIIRHAWSFKYQKGARPKVLSLLFGK